LFLKRGVVGWQAVTAAASMEDDMANRVIGQWQVTRANGERVVFEGQTEREAQLLAREAFPEDGRFEVMLISRICERCRATVPGAGRCEACQAKRDARKRSYIVRVAFLLRAGWSAPFEARVKAFSVAGATALGVREAKRTGVKRGARITQTKIDVLAVRKSAAR
jgi:hypothetical protein